MSNCDTTALIAEIVRRWRAQGMEPLPGHSLEEIHAFEKRVNVSLPASVVQFYRAIDGTELGDTDEHFLQFWTLAEVETEARKQPEECPELDGYLVIADFSICVHGYAVGIHGDDHLLIAWHGAPIRIAATFPEFLAKYLNEPDALFPQALR